MRVFSSHKELLKSIDSSKLLGLVPTMGSLHEGHFSLVQKALSENEQVIVSIYVNPTQFNNETDWIKYPKNIEEDIEKLKQYKNLLIYTPSDKDLYNKVISKKYDLDNLDKVLEGKFRPGHFDGVATIVEKLFVLFNPVNAYFGEKDFQQLSVIKVMVKKLDFNIHIKPCKTIREPDGLAMSSRNKLMNKEERSSAGKINKLMLKVKNIYKDKKIDKIPDGILSELNNLKNFKLEYFEIDNLSKYSSNLKDEGDRIYIACWIGKTRIIDNMPLK